jgi:hypothetical protein
MAILFGAFLIQGLTPGPEMLTVKLPITFSMMWSLIFANIIAAVLLLAYANQLQRIIFIPAHLVVPGITLFVLIGAWSIGANIGDWVTLFLFGVIGVVMKRAGWPRPPLVLGFILGRIMENSLHLSMAAYGLSWVLRPIPIVIAIIIVITVFFAIRSYMRRSTESTIPMVGDADSGDARISLIFGGLVFLVLAYGIAATYPWPATVRLFPLVFGIPALLLAAGALVTDWRALAATGGAILPRDKHGGIGLPRPSLEFLRTCSFFGWLLGVLAVTILLGQHVSLPLFVALYLMVWGGYRWPFAIGYAAAGLVLMVLLFDYLSPTLWYPALLLR